MKTAIREFEIRLNNSNWSSYKTRANGMFKLSIAQLNSSTLDQKEFAKKVTIGIINKIIAPLGAKYPELQEKLTLSDAETLCKELQTALRLSDIAAAEIAAKSAETAAYDAYAVAYAAAAEADKEAAYAAAKAATHAAAYAAKEAAYADYAATYTAANAAKAAAEAAVKAAYAAEVTGDDAYAAKAATHAAAAAAYAADVAGDDAGYDARDKVLIQASDICLEVLKEMKVI